VLRSIRPTSVPTIRRRARVVEALAVDQHQHARGVEAAQSRPHLHRAAADGRHAGRLEEGVPDRQRRLQVEARRSDVSVRSGTAAASRSLRAAVTDTPISMRPGTRTILSVSGVPPSSTATVRDSREKTRRLDRHQVTSRGNAAKPELPFRSAWANCSSPVARLRSVTGPRQHGARRVRRRSHDVACRRDVREQAHTQNTAGTTNH